MSGIKKASSQKMERIKKKLAFSDTLARLPAAARQKRRKRRAVRQRPAREVCACVREIFRSQQESQTLSAVLLRECT